MTPEEQTRFEIELVGYCAHMPDRLEHGRRVGQLLVRRGKRLRDKPRRIRKPSVARVIQQMKRAGVEIAGCEINPRDGTVRVIAGKPVGDIANPHAGGDGINTNTTTPIDRSEWN